MFKPTLPTIEKITTPSGWIEESTFYWNFLLLSWICVCCFLSGGRFFRLRWMIKVALISFITTRFTGHKSAQFLCSSVSIVVNVLHCLPHQMAPLVCLCLNQPFFFVTNYNAVSITNCTTTPGVVYYFHSGLLEYYYYWWQSWATVLRNKSITSYG